MTAEPTTRAVDVAGSEEIPERGRLIVEIGTTPPRTAGIFRFRGELRAYENRCAHQGGPACQGRIVSRVREDLDDRKASRGLVFDPDTMHIVCPWHGFEYDVTTGAHPGRPDFALRAFEVSESGGRVRVHL
ncbi:Rieske (2Fe-2S) protein [Pseudonocardia nantongensis]|uniref:Rieske (2Fe-2S) protein n=1 Tax=Pseudonocardia nantongensis TaxID=1181885 RepID=UPI00397BDCAC